MESRQIVILQMGSSGRGNPVFVQENGRERGREGQKSPLKSNSKICETFRQKYNRKLEWNISLIGSIQKATHTYQYYAQPLGNL